MKTFTAKSKQKMLQDFEKDLKNVENNYDYYDSSESTKKLIESEKRQIRRLISVVEILPAVEK